MKRDLDLIRDMLLRIEDISNGARLICVEDFTDLCDDRHSISYHLELLEDAGYIAVIDHPYTDDYKDFALTRLTMLGADYLDSVRNNSIWRKVKDKLEKVGNDASLKIVCDVATSIMKQQLGI